MGSIMTVSRKSNTLRALLVTLGLLGSAVAFQALAADAIYKWVDESGETHYSQTRPSGDYEVELVKGAPPPADNPEQVKQHLQRQVDEMTERNKEQNDVKKEAISEAEYQKLVKENCTNARNNLGALEQGGRKRYLTPEGEVVRLTEEERQSRIAEANKQIKEYCK
jgi:hypothetical protein